MASLWHLSPTCTKWSLFFNCIDKALDTYSNYDHVLLAGDFSAEDHEPCLSNFLYQYDLYNLCKVCTCFKNSSKPISIDLFLTNKNTHFQNTVAVCNALSDFHQLVLTVLKTSFDKNKPCEILYRGYKNFNSESFHEDLQNISSTTQINTCKQFEDTLLSVLNVHAPLKKKLLRANHSQYVTKALRKAIMRSSKLEKTYFNPLSANPTKWSNTPKQFVGNLPTNCLSVFDHFVILALKGLRNKLINYQKPTRSRKVIAASFIKKKEKSSVTISIHLLYPIIRLFGK